MPDFAAFSTETAPRPGRVPELADGGWLRDRYVARGRSLAAIARELGCTPPAVLAALRRAGIKTRPPGRPRRRASG